MNSYDLTFNVVDGRLTGKIGTYNVNAVAGSGGRSGSKTQGACNYFLANNPFATHTKLEKTKPGSVGGTLPQGIYTLRTHEKKHNQIRLVPDTGNDMHGRDGFLIHGRGPRGSDGCIVPSDFHVVVKLYEVLKKQEADGLPAPSLQVIAVGADPDLKLQQWRTTA